MMETSAKVRIMGIGLMNIARNPRLVATRAVRTAGPAAVIVSESASFRSRTRHSSSNREWNWTA